MSPALYKANFISMLEILLQFFGGRDSTSRPCSARMIVAKFSENLVFLYCKFNTIQK